MVGRNERNSSRDGHQVLALLVFDWISLAVSLSAFTLLFKLNQRGMLCIYDIFSEINKINIYKLKILLNLSS